MPLVIFDVFYRSDSSRMFYVRKCARCVLLRFFLRHNFEGIATSRIASTGTLRNNTAQEKQRIYIPHLYSNPFAIHDDCLHFEVDACRYHKRYLVRYASSLHMIGGTGYQWGTKLSGTNWGVVFIRTYRRYMWFVELVAGKSTQDTRLPNTRIANKEDFEEIIIALSHALCTR